MMEISAGAGAPPLSDQLATFDPPLDRDKITDPFRAAYLYLQYEGIPIDAIKASDISAMFREALKEKKELIKIFPQPLPEHNIEVIYQFYSEFSAVDFILRQPAPLNARPEAKRYKKHPCIGHGAFKRIFNSIGFSISTTLNLSIITDCMVAKIKPWIYQSKGIESLLNLRTAGIALPPSLLSIPDSIGISPEGRGKSIYLTMPRLENPDLSYILTKPIEEILPPLFQGAAKTARACQFLHEHGLIHRDIALSNMTVDGLFDYDTLGAQEIPEEADKSDFDEEASEVYQLGYQFARVFGYRVDPTTWEAVDPETQRFFQRVLNKDPAARPSMEEFATFLESTKEYHSRGRPTGK
ncbi:MAG: protein kinase family protein [Simkaniaceae bacterium]|nr:protein kinase family protein [Simkaniaceae bacterium]